MRKLYCWFCILPICLIIQGNNIAQSESYSQGYITAQNGILFTHDTSGNKSRISTYNKELRIYNWDRGSILFFAGLSPGSILYEASMIISDEKNVGIGTYNPEQLLHVLGNNPRILVEGNSGNPEVNFKNAGDASTAIWALYKESNSDDLRFYQGGDKVTIQNATGNVGIGTINPGYKLEVNGDAAKPGGGNWSVSSDKRLKDITGVYKGGLVEILELQPVTFYYKEGNQRSLPSDKEYIGFIAQEVQEVFPEAVSEGLDGYFDFNMHPVNVAVVNAIQELKAQNDSLKAENDLLKRDIEKIKEILGI